MIHSLEEIIKFQELCNEALEVSTAAKRPALIIMMSVRQKYTNVHMGAARKDSFFNRTLYIKSPNSSMTRTIQKVIGKIIPSDLSDFNGRFTEGIINDGFQCPHEALSVYAVFNPRNQVNALHTMHHKIITGLLYNQQSAIPDNFVSEFLSTLHAAPQSDKLYVEIDVDTKEPELLKKFSIKAGHELFTNLYFVVETQGGYHFVYKKDKFPQNLYEVLKLQEFTYKDIARDGKILPNQPYFSFRGDVCFPIPGTYQRGVYPVTFANIENIKQMCGITPSSDIVTQSDLPRLSDGIVPDIIMSPSE